MKRQLVFNIIIAILCFPLLFGMGSQGGATTDKIPDPAKKFKAIFVDQMDITTECSDVSIEGTTAFEGKRGEGIYSIAFENVQQVVFRLQAEKLYGQIKLQDGSTIELAIGKDKKAYGRTPFGTFQIRLNDLKKMTVTPVTQKKS